MAFTSYEDLGDTSRIWIYRANRQLQESEISNIDEWLTKFLNQWTAHNQTLNAYGKVFRNQFLVIMLDEGNSANASGCSIDAQVHFIKEIEKAVGIDLFDRMHFDFDLDGEILTLHKSKVKENIEEGRINNDSLVYDHLVKNKSEFETKWLKPLSQSWHSKLI